MQGYGSPAGPPPPPPTGIPRTWAAIAVLGALVGGAGLAYAVAVGNRPPPPPAPIALAAAASSTPQPPQVVVVTATPVPVSPTPAIAATPVVPSATPMLPSPTVPPKPGAVLYQANWDAGSDGWPVSNSWKWVRGMVVNDGQRNDDLLISPYRPPMADYAVETEAQLLDGDLFVIGRTALVARWSASYPSTLSVFRGAGQLPDLKSGPRLAGGTNWLNLRLEVQGNAFRLLINRALTIEAIENQFLEPGTVGLGARQGKVSVRAFRVVAL